MAGRQVAAVAVAGRAVLLTALATTGLLLGGCGGSDRPATPVTTIRVQLSGGGFAPSTPKTIRVPRNSLITAKVTTDGDGPYRFSVFSTKTAQTFKLKSNDSLGLTLDAPKPGDPAKLIVGDETVKIVTAAD